MKQRKQNQHQEKGVAMPELTCSEKSKQKLIPHN